MQHSLFYPYFQQKNFCTIIFERDIILETGDDYFKKTRLNEAETFVQPPRLFTLYFTDFLPNHTQTIYDYNNKILFSINVISYDNNWYSGFFYSPKYSKNDEDISHEYPINLKFSTAYPNEKLAFLGALSQFIDMYNNIEFQYKNPIYHFIYQFINQNQWLEPDMSYAISLELGSKKYQDAINKIESSLRQVEKTYQELL